MKALIPSESIERKIFLIRGQKVMLSTHLAQLYGIETRVLMQAGRRNSDRFPDDFKFTLTRDEIMRISQIVTSLKYGHPRKFLSISNLFIDQACHEKRTIIDKTFVESHIPKFLGQTVEKIKKEGSLVDIGLDEQG